jgi:hypothetical protein
MIAEVCTKVLKSSVETIDCQIVSIAGFKPKPKDFEQQLMKFSNIGMIYHVILSIGL